MVKIETGAGDVRKEDQKPTLREVRRTVVGKFDFEAGGNAHFVDLDGHRIVVPIRTDED